MNTTLSIPPQLLTLPAMEMSAALQIISAIDAGKPLHNIYDLAAAMQTGVYTARKISKSLEKIGFLKREEQHDSNGRFLKSLWSFSLDFLFKRYDGEQRAENRHTVETAVNGDFPSSEVPENVNDIPDIIDIFSYVDIDTAERLNIKAVVETCKPEKVRNVLKVLKMLIELKESFIYYPKNKAMQTFTPEEVSEMVAKLDAQTFKKLCNNVNPRTNPLNYVFATLLNKCKDEQTIIDERYSEAMSGNSFTKKQMKAIIIEAETACRSYDISTVSAFLSALWNKKKSYTYNKNKEYSYFLSMIRNAASPADLHTNHHKRCRHKSSSAPSYDLDELFNYALTHTPKVKCP